MLQLKNVSKFYYSKGIVTSGFSKVNLELNIGEFVAITGESGSGKSTLLNVLSGLDSYEEGEMYVEGEDTSAYSEAEWEKYRRKYISNIFQSFNLVNSYTVYQNVELALLLSGYRGKDKKQDILDVLRRVDLYDYRHQRASRLSGGQKQRVAIARALVRNTPIIVADEPTGNLDSKSAANVIEMLSKVASDKLVLVVTHNYDQVEDFVTRKLTMHDGQLIEDMHLRDRVPNAEAAPAGEETTALESGAEEIAATEETPVAGGVYEEKILRVNFFQRIRLGIRNAFNIIPKFLLLLIVFLFVSVATAGYYVTNLEAKENAYSYKYNYYFSNNSEKRIIIKKSNGSTISKSDIARIEKIDNVDTVYEDDLLLDNQVSMQSDMYWLSGSGSSIKNFTGELKYGVMPSGENEFILSIPYNYYLNDEDIINELMTYTYTISDWNDGSALVRDLVISGITISDEYGYTTNFFCDDSIIEVIRSNTNLNYSTIEVTINNETYKNESYSYEYKIRPSENVAPGEALVSEEVNWLFEKGKCKGQEMGVHISNLYYNTDATFTMTDTYNKKTWEKKTGITKDYYEWQSGSIFINADEYAAFFGTESYQSSVFVKDEELVHETAAELEKMGYTPLCMADTLVDDSQVYQKIENIFNIVRTIILFVATFFIAYFVIRLIMKSRNTYFTTVRILGATKGDCLHLLLTDLMTVLCVAYVIFLGVIVATDMGYLKISFLENYLTYMTPLHYGILFAVLLVVCLLISLRYSRKLFKSSAMKTYKEVA